MISSTYRTLGGIDVAVAVEAVPVEGACDALIAALDRSPGLLLSSGVEMPGRYARWDMGFVDPPLVLTSVGRAFTVEALNARGRVLLPGVLAALRDCNAVGAFDLAGDVISGDVRPSTERFPEEERSRQPSIFSIVRRLRDLFGSEEDRHLGLYGAFGYDLAYQFEPVQQRIAREADQRDLVLYLPDRLVIVDRARGAAEVRRYEFGVEGSSTEGLTRSPSPLAGEGGPAKPGRMRGAPGASERAPEGINVSPTDPSSVMASPCHLLPQGEKEGAATSDHGPGDYVATVARAKECFARGDLFEVVPGQTFRAPCPDAPSAVFRRLVAANPAPYGALINLGEGEFLVAASPEMFVRVRGRRVETCPISGTIARGRDAFEDADQIRALLASSKDEAELTMCTDVDRNDKARICEPGSVRVIARRQIETYSRLFHTVDHVEGRLRPEMDALDAFLSHAWAVTVTGAPKRGAMDFIERNERSARRWYGGAIGRVTFDGNMDTGITIRTVRLKDGLAEVRAGATLLHDSDPEAEDAECALKASAMLASVAGVMRPLHAAGAVGQVGAGRRIVLVDCEDSFVHNLADYLRQTGASVSTFRHADAMAEIRRAPPDLVVLSPGPGRPADFALDGIIAAARGLELPIFGVCLGLQSLVEHFGGALDQLAVPVHGKASEIAILPGSRFFAGLPDRLAVGRYHSLHARLSTFPPGLRIVGRSDDGVVMAIEHASLPIAAVQFHPESILSARADAGLALLARVVERLLAAPLNTGREPESPAPESARPEAARPEAAAAGGA